MTRIGNTRPVMWNIVIGLDIVLAFATLILASID